MRHRFHAICPYFAMFPETFVEKHLAASRYAGVVFDPFCGRGTTVFEALLRGRSAAGCDVNPVAVCVSGAKCDPPSKEELLQRVLELEMLSQDYNELDVESSMAEFFNACFQETTFRELSFLRRSLAWREDRVDRFIAALCLGALHGESHRSPNYFSNRMPRTISTKPAYSLRWWAQNNCVAPRREVYAILKNLIDFRYRTPPPTLTGEIVEADARFASLSFPHLKGMVTDLITSPPYLDTTNYREDQWLRLWFLGEKPQSNQDRGDGRHYSKDGYWTFLAEVWKGVAELLAPKARIVIRIGGRRLTKEETFASLYSSLESAIEGNVVPKDHGVTSAVRRTQANSFRGSKPTPTVEHDFCFLFNKDAPIA